MNQLKIIITSLFSSLLISLTSFSQMADFDGSLKIGNDTAANAEAGTIRWNPTTKNFEGYNGQNWMSLTNGISPIAYYISNDEELKEAVQSNASHIVLINDIQLNSSITLNNPVLIESSGTSKTIEGTEVFYIDGNGITIQNISFQSTGTGNAITIKSGIENLCLNHLTFDNYSRAIYKSGGPEADWTRNIKIMNTAVNNSTISGAIGTISINRKVENILIDKVTINGSGGEGIEIANDCSGQISNVVIKNTAEIGLELWNTSNDALPYASFEVTNVTVRDCGLWGISFADARVTGSNLSTHNTVGIGIEIVSDTEYSYKPVQLSNILISRVKFNETNNYPAIGISIDQHAGANISNFHIQGLEVNPFPERQSFGIQARLSEHFSIHDGQFVNLDIGIMIQGENQLAQNGSIMDNRFLNVVENFNAFGSEQNIDTDNNKSW